MTVNGWSHPYHNEYLCTSGSFTGEVCGVRVDTSTAYSYCSNNPWGVYECYGGMYRAWQNAGLRAVQSGDSGGPVYNYNRSAMGIISGGNGKTARTWSSSRTSTPSTRSGGSSRSSQPCAREDARPTPLSQGAVGPRRDGRPACWLRTTRGPPVPGRGGEAA